MKKNLILYILLGFLLIANGFFLMNHISKPDGKRSKGPKGPGNFIVKELQFNDDQLEKFNELNDEHHRKMRRLSQNVRKLKDELFNNISVSSVNDTEIDSLTSLIGNTEKLKDLEVFNHFRRIQALCDEKQKEKFNLIIKNALHTKGPRNEGPPGRRDRREGRRPPPPPPEDM